MYANYYFVEVLELLKPAPACTVCSSPSCFAAQIISGCTRVRIDYYVIIIIIIVDGVCGTDENPINRWLLQPARGFPKKIYDIKRV